MKWIPILIAVLGATLVSDAATAPPGPPPTVGGVNAAPPPAWIETPASSRWLAFSSYCWTARPTRKAACVDMVLPQSREDLPAVRVRAGTIVRLHLRFHPREVHVTTFVRGSFKHEVLRAKRVAAWRPKASGVVSFDVRAAAGSAAYLARLYVVP